MPAKKEQIIALDIWDTVLRRTCHPDEIKLYTAQRMRFLLAPYLLDTPNMSIMETLNNRREVEYQIGLSRKKEGFDDEYEIDDVLDKCIIKATGNRIDQATKTRIRNELVNSEIEQEIYVTSLDPDLINMLQSFEFKKAIVISDFYMSWKKVARILEANSFPFPIDNYFMSCDSRLNKRSGRLFSHVSSELNVPPESILHIGDNEHSDVLMAQANGLRTHYFSGTSGHFDKLKKERIFTARSAGDIKATRLLQEKLACRNTTILNKDYKQARLFNHGKHMSLLFVGFALYIQELCSRGQHKRVYFFTREGKFFKKVFDRVLEQNPYSLEPIASHLLPVSRLATFFPSLRTISCQEMMRIWSQYNTQSMGALFRSLDLSSSDYTDLLEKYQIPLEKPLQNPWQDDRINKLFVDKEFIDRLSVKQQARKILLKDYFKSLAFGLDNRAFIVDIGWRGSIQDNIAHIYPNVKIDGAYMGLQKFFNTQPDNTEKFGYIVDYNRKIIMHPLLCHVRPFEMLCNVTGGSACGYQKNNSGEITPIYKIDDDEDRVHTEWISHVQDGIIESIEHACHVIKQHGISVGELQAISANLSAQLISNPPREICQAYFALNHNETFGMGQFIQPANTFRLSDKLLGYLMPTRRQKFLNSLEQSGWPQGLLKYRYGGIVYNLGKIKNKFR